ncbi:MAG: DUF362 domain-containing protein [Ruminiclostridium sp.]
MEKSRVLVDMFNKENNLGDMLYKNFAHKLNKVRVGDIILLKPNMFMTDKGFYTNPELLMKVAKAFKNLGAKVIIAERLQVMADVLKEFKAIYDYADVISFDNMPTRKIKIQNATSLRQEIEIPEIIFECDFLVGVPQFRTHAGVLMSNALKNMVGILPGFTTRIIHNVGLTEAIVDINRIRPQDMVICDLTTTIEGNYPIEGIPVERNCIIVADNALAADLVAADLSGFIPGNVSYLSLAGQAGMGPCYLNEIQIIKDYENLKYCCIKSGVDKEIKDSKLSFEYESACNECKRYCNALKELFDSHGMSDTELIIASGPDIPRELSGKDSSKLVLVGNCTYYKRNCGIYIEGCPPRAIQGLAVLEWLKNKGDVSEPYRNQCRWPE